MDGADLRLEFQTADNVVGLLKSGVREVRLALDGVEEVCFQKGWFGCSLVIRVAGMRGASEVPNFKRGEIALSIAKKHSKAAADFISTIRVRRGSGEASPMPNKAHAANPAITGSVRYPTPVARGR